MPRGRLFDPHDKADKSLVATESLAVCRVSDPETSREAAVFARAVSGRSKRAILAVADDTPRTANELAIRVLREIDGKWNQETLRKRCLELCVVDGVLIQCGFRRCEFSHKSAQTYRRIAE